MDEPKIPALGPRGEGWVVAQFALGVVIAVAGIAGLASGAPAGTTLLVAGVAIAVAGQALFVAGIVGLGSALTPFPKPSEGEALRVGGIYRWARHPIYGGVLLIALGWSFATSPLALVPSALLLVVLELKSRYEESMLAERYPEYDAYRRRVRWRFVPWVR
ncbi:MAG: isoprenylcysteine carboxylmethyltransferase family protein [Actinomycetota bacterium]